MSPVGVEVELSSHAGEILKFKIFPGTGDSLLELFERAGVKSPFGCRVGTCATCVVRVLKGADLLEAPRQMESDTLARVPEAFGSPARLPCRAILKPGAHGTLMLEKILIL